MAGWPMFTEAVGKYYEVLRLPLEEGGSYRRPPWQSGQNRARRAHLRPAR